MAVPKKRMSRSKSRKRRTHYRIIQSAMSVCTNCKSICIPHRICNNCGYYKNKNYLNLK